MARRTCVTPCPSESYLAPTMDRPGRRRRGWLGTVVLGLATFGAVVAGSNLWQAAAEEKPADKSAAGLEVFQKHVRLTLAHKCVRCHGGEHTEGGLNLVTREGLLRGGENGKVVEPGNHRGSKLYKLAARLEEPYMPEEGENLTPAELSHLAQWIDGGAPYDKPLLDANEVDDWTQRKVAADARQFWSFQPLANPTVPGTSHAAWCETPLDRFVAAKLEEKKLSPAREADRRRLIRRATFDLVGLPPTPEDVDEFANDPSPDAYERLLDRLLASPAHGERWARHWLDVARFAESHGFEQDYDRPFAYHFRDFVIRALNADLPYDQFVRWQVAGDELAPDDPLALMATGFLGAGVFPTQITANEVERTRYDALDDMASTTGTAFLGLTVGCARCHDHKFDPIPAADYYRMISVFTTTVRSEIDLDLDPQGYQAAKAEFDRRHAPLAAELAKFEAEQLPARLAEWEAQRTSAAPPPAKWLAVEVESAKSQGGATFVKQPDGSLLVGGTNAASDVYTIVVNTELTGITGLRLEALADPSLPKNGPGRAGNGNFALTDVKLTATPRGGGAAQPVALQHPSATFEQKGLPVKAILDGDAKSGWAVDPQFGRNHAAVVETAGDLGFPGGTTLTLTLTFQGNTGHNIGRPRVSLTTAPRPVKLTGETLPAQVAQALATPRESRSPAQTAALLGWYKFQDAQWRTLQVRMQNNLAKAPQPKRAKVMVCSEGVKPIRHHTQGADFFNETYFLRRGNSDQKQGVSQPGYLQVLMRSPQGEKQWQSPRPATAKTSFRRVGLANWLVDVPSGAGALAARVMVNRMWHHHLGRGIVSTTSDFGKQGTPPTHPELLDYLAQELLRREWSLKSLHRQIMTSAVYRQGSDHRATMAQIDPENQWLWRCTPRRLEAEPLRDTLLAVSGELQSPMYGPGTLDEGHPRRSIYFMIKRSRLIGSQQLFDAPEPLVSIGQRSTTTVAPQALMLLNSPHVRRYAVSWAKRLATSASGSADPAAVVRQAYRTALQRDPSPAESADAATFLAQQATSYATARRDHPQTLALADLCQVLFGLNEFVFVD